MGALLSYSLSVSAFILVLFPALHQISNRSTNFRYNRAAILCGSGLSLIIPCILKTAATPFPIDVTESNSMDILNINPSPAKTQTVIDNNTDIVGSTFSFPWLPVAIVIYFSGIIVLLIREMLSFENISVVNC